MNEMIPNQTTMYTSALSGCCATTCMTGHSLYMTGSFVCKSFTVAIIILTHCVYRHAQ